MTPLQLALTLLAGMLVGVDLASFPQAMFSRPIVAGLLGGAAAGHPLAGLGVGAILELFAMDTLPVGASRSPDWGPGSVAAGALVSRSARLDADLLALVLVAVLAAWAGGWFSHFVRRANTRAAQAHREALEAGDVAAIRSLQRMGLLRDCLRSLGLTTLSLGAGVFATNFYASRWHGPDALALLALAASSIGVALFAGLRVSGTGRQRLWLAGGLAAGTLVAATWLR